MKAVVKHLLHPIRLLLLVTGCIFLSGCVLPIAAAVVTCTSPFWHYQMYTGGYELETFPTWRYHATYGTCNKWCGETIAVPFYIPVMLPYGIAVGTAFDVAFFPIDWLAYAAFGTSETAVVLAEQETEYRLQMPPNRRQVYGCASYAKHATLFSLKAEQGALKLPFYCNRDNVVKTLTISSESLADPKKTYWTFPKGSTLFFVLSASRGNPFLPGVMEVNSETPYVLTFQSFGVVPPEAMPKDGSFPYEWMRQTYIDRGFNGSLNEERTYLTGFMSNHLDPLAEPQITRKSFSLPSQLDEQGRQTLQFTKSSDFKGELRCFGLTRDIRRQATATVTKP